MSWATDLIDDYKAAVVTPLRLKLRRTERERDRYKDALYHIGYRGADPKPAALEALGDLAPSPTEGTQDA